MNYSNFPWKTFPAVLIGVFLLLPGAFSQEPAPVPLRPSRLERAGVLSSVLAGPLGEQVRAVTDQWLLSVPERNPALLAMFADRDREPLRDLLPWSGEFAGKYLTACTQVIRLTRNALLEEKLRGFVQRFVALQDEDGYLGPLARPYRLAAAAPNVAGPTWDAWGHYHAMLGLLLWHEQSGDKQALRCAEKIGGLLCDRFLGNGRHVADMGSPDQNQAVIHGLALLYGRTGTKRYLELAEQIVAEFSIAGAGDYLRTALAGTEFHATPKPRWESLHAIMGLAELHRLTGREDYRHAFEHIWWSIVKLDRHNNGGFSSGEQAVGNPYNGAPIETCCTISWLATSLEMLRMTGNPIVADEMELSTLNSVFGLHSADGSWSTYNTPMDGRRIPSTEDISFQIRPGAEQLNCCSVNAARGFGMISEWALMGEAGSADRPAALVLNWYGPSTFSARVADTRVTLTQETLYPRDGHIEMAVQPEKPVRFPLKLRIPYWSAIPRVRVNGMAFPAEPGTYCVLDRTWNAGDRVTIDFDMRVRSWAGEQECAGKVSLYRGPLLLAYDTPPESALRQRPGKWQAFGKLHASREKEAGFEFDFEGESIKWFGHLFDDAGKARVEIDGKEIAVVDQYGPVRESPFSWEHKGLVPGRHTIRIVVTGEKQGASRDAWCNVLGFGKVDSKVPDLETPGIAPLDMQTFHATPIESSTSDGALLRMEAGDATGILLRLRDFATAGRDRRRYISWLPAKNIQSTPFSRSNPLRGSAVTR